MRIECMQFKLFIMHHAMKAVGRMARICPVDLLFGTSNQCAQVQICGHSCRSSGLVKKHLAKAQ